MAQATAKGQEVKSVWTPHQCWMIIHTATRVVLGATMDGSAKTSPQDSLVEWKGAQYDLANGPWKLNATADGFDPAAPADYDQAMTLPLSEAHQTAKDLAHKIKGKAGLDPDLTAFVQIISDLLFQNARRD